MTNQPIQVEGSDSAPTIGAKPSDKSVPVFRGFRRQHFKDQYKAYEPLVRIFSWMRPHMSDAEQEFVHTFLDKLGCEHDEIGNRFLIVGPANPKTLWSCHTDTVHHKGGYQRLNILRDSKGDNYLGVHRGDGNCLGGDDGTGVWILLEMIKADVPGLYVFHRGEEKGCIGSRWIADHNPGFLKGIERAIAFDRKDYTNIITHQGGDRGCSVSFANKLAEQLGMGYKPDDTGLYTDTARYFKLVSECTNISVGYNGAHGPMETQNVTFAMKLLESILALKPDDLPTVRDPKFVENKYRYDNTHHHNTNSGRHHWNPVSTARRRFNGTPSNFLSTYERERREKLLADLELSLYALVIKYPSEAMMVLRQANRTNLEILTKVYDSNLVNMIIDGYDEDDDEANGS
jgi:hypothetical protein